MSNSAKDAVLSASVARAAAVAQAARAQVAISGLISSDSQFCLICFSCVPFAFSLFA